MKKIVQDIMLTKKFVIGLKTASFLYGFASLLAATFNFMFPFTEKKELLFLLDLQKVLKLFEN